ncbi:unnamed protein product [Boreogadus saida]
MLGRLRPGGSDAAQRSAQDAVFQLGCWQLQGLVHRTSPQAHIRQDTLFLTPAPLLRVPLQPALASTSLNQCIFPLGDLRIWGCLVLLDNGVPLEPSGACRRRAEKDPIVRSSIVLLEWPAN